MVSILQSLHIHPHLPPRSKEHASLMHSPACTQLSASLTAQLSSFLVETLVAATWLNIIKTVQEALRSLRTSEGAPRGQLSVPASVRSQVLTWAHIFFPGMSSQSHLHPLHSCPDTSGDQPWDMTPVSLLPPAYIVLVVRPTTNALKGCCNC